MSDAVERLKWLCSPDALDVIDLLRRYINHVGYNEGIQEKAS